MKINYLYFIIVFALLCLSCSDDAPPVANETQPNIEEIRMTDKWNPRLGQAYKIEVVANDPQGSENLSAVLLSVRKDSGGSVIYTDSLHDDGAWFNKDDGDVLAHDGIFSDRYTPQQINPQSPIGMYYFSFDVFDSDGNQGATVEIPVSFGENIPPEITRISAPDSFSIFAPDSAIQITVNDSDGIDDIKSVFFESRIKGAISSKFEGQLYNDGDAVHGDAVAGDSVFSTVLTTPFLVGKNGTYELLFFAQDNFGEINTETAVHEIDAHNFPPQYSSLGVSDVIKKPVPPDTYNRSTITMAVSDPEGLTDIAQVYFYSLKPDSTLANNGQPIQMQDNGLPFNENNPGIEVGDEVAGDGIYTFPLLVTPDTESGIYKLSFYVTDKANNITGPVEREITIE
jgi:hypothetical protein